MSLTRRTVLKAGAAGLAAGIVPVPGLSRLVFAAEPAARPLLVVVHLRGGMDGLNFISPASDADFIAARATELRVAADGPNAGHALAHGPDPKVDFRLHHAASGLAELYQSGNAAFIHACGLTDGTRSHFVASDMIDRGVADDASLGRIGDGWLTRHLHGMASGGLVAASASASVAGELIGENGAIAVADLNGGLVPAGGPQAREVLARLYGGGGVGPGKAGRDALAAMATIDGKLTRDPKNAVVPYQPESGANYDSAAEFGRPLKTLAQLVKLDIGLEAATVDIGGWDTHEYQPGRFKNAVEHLSNGIAAFWNDTSRYHDRMILVTLSEFGRRLRSNKSQGTDHGRGNVMMVLGGKVRGGRFYGAWPGLANAKLDQGVDLAVATDYRRVLAEVLQQRSPGAPVFPGYTSPGPLGIFAAA